MKPLEISPGVFHGATDASVGGANFDEAHLIRWNSKRMEPMRGWEKHNFSPFASPVRKVHVWNDNSNNTYVAYLCEAHLYVASGASLLDITPVGGITPPSIDFTYGGYGDGLYGAGLYGTRRDPVDRIRLVVPCFTADNWGQQLLVMSSSDGRLLYWDPTVIGSKAAVVPGAPTGNRSFVVTSERHVMLFAMGGGFRTFGWSDEENYSNWDMASVTSKAGNYDVEPAAPITSHVLSDYGVLMFTTLKVYIITSVGLPYVYAYKPISESCFPLSPASVCNTSVGPIWISASGFWTYNGSSVTPIECPVWSWISDRINLPISGFMAFAVNLSSYNEMWWFFTSKSSTDVCDKFIVYNYKEGWWSMGSVSRTAAHDNGRYPVMTTKYDSYKHESGYTYSGADQPWIRTGVINVDGGGGMTTLLSMMPDVDGDATNVSFWCKCRTDRSVSSWREHGPFKINSAGIVNIRKTGRDISLKVSLDAGAGFFTLGSNLIDAVQRGGR